MWQTIRKLVMVSRPVSWVNTMYPFAAAYLMTGGSIDVYLLVGSLFFLIPYNLLMYGVNDVFDYESDIKNPRKGGIEGMREQRSFHPTILRWSALLVAPFFVTLLLFGDWQANLALSLVLFMVVAYSVKGLRFKEIPVLDSITSSTHFVGPLIYGLILTGSLYAAWPFVLAMFLWGMASHAFGAVQDILPDRKGGLASIATVFGARLSVWFSLVLYTAASLLVVLQGGLAQIAGLALLMYVFNLLPYVRITDKLSANAHVGWRRFLWINMVVGAIVTIVLLLVKLSQS